MTAAHVATFRKLDVSALPDVHGLDDEARQVLWALTACKDDHLLEWTSPAEVSEILRDCARIDVPRQRVQALLEQERKQGAVARQRKNGKHRYMIMRPGEQKLNASLVAPLFIDPERAFTATRKLADIFGDLKGSIRFCDPYIASRTLDYLAECRGASGIQLLTVNVQGATSFKADMSAFNREHGGKLEARVIGQGHLHDRYVVHDDGILLMGASVKDAGKKQSFVVSAGKDIAAAVTPAFDKVWAQAAPV